MSNISTVYFNSAYSVSAYQNEVILNNEILRSTLAELVSIPLIQLITLVHRAVIIIIPILPVNYENRAEQVDILLVEHLCFAVRNILAVISRYETNQPNKMIMAKLSRACWAIYTACHNSRVKIAYHTTNYLIDPDKYQPQIKINPVASQLLDRIQDSLTIETNTDQLIQTIINGITFSESGVAL